MLQKKPNFLQLEKIGCLSNNWDSYEAESPNEFVIKDAQRFLESSLNQDFLPTDIIPSVEGGISFLFINV